ncbi:hypothetical protein TNCV_2890511 [Trichonephila clavipes]|nr:hypothetical protein TNCV_2890511 [Trichonephila clavipes]
MQPDLRKLICEHIIRVLQHQKDVNQKQHICVKHDFVGEELCAIVFVAAPHQVMLQHIDFCTVQSFAKLPT